jgi:hypothetical protein
LDTEGNPIWHFYPENYVDLGLEPVRVYEFGGKFYERPNGQGRQYAEDGEWYIAPDGTTMGVITPQYTTEMMSFINQNSDKILMSVSDSGRVAALGIELTDEGGSRIFALADEVILDADVIADAISAKTAMLGGIHLAYGEIWANNGSAGSWKISQDGTIYASNASISGNVYAQNGYFSGEIQVGSGKIGGLIINNNSIASENGNFSISSDGTLYAKNASISGNVYAQNGYFSGELQATTGKIGGLIISNNSIESENGNFKVSSDGSLYANNGYFRGEIHATNGDFSDTINAKAGNIGGLEIGDGIKSKNGNFSLDSGGNLTVNSIQINTDDFVLGKNIYNNVGEFVNTEGTNVDVDNLLDILVWSSTTQITSINDIVTIEAPTFDSIYLANYSFNGAPQKVSVKITYSIDSSVLFDNLSIDDWSSYIKPKTRPELFYYCEDNLAKLFCSDELSYDEIRGPITFEQTVSYGNITGETIQTDIQTQGNYTIRLLGDGHYISNLQTWFEKFGNAYNYGSITLYLALRITRITIKGVKINQGTEIFSNGFGLKCNENNYFFVNRSISEANPNVKFNLASNGSGITLDNSGFYVDTRFAVYNNIRKFGGSGTSELTNSDDIIMYQGNGGVITIPNQSAYQVGRTFKVFNFLGNQMRIKATTPAIFKPQGDSTSECGVIMGGKTFSNPHQRWIYEIIRIPTTTINGKDQDGREQSNVQCNWLILEY